jgi:hypothetical protein
MNPSTIAAATLFALAVLTFLDFKPSGPRIVAGIGARIQARRKRLEALEEKIANLTAVWQTLDT